MSIEHDSLSPPHRAAGSGAAEPDAPAGSANLVRRPDLGARLDGFVGALADPDPARLAEEIARLRRDGVADATLLDDLLPAAARALGALWAEDRLSFAAVTIGCARLQGLLHRAEPPAAPEPDGPGVVLCAMPGSQHTLGTLLAAAQLRRARVSVRLALGTESEIAATVRAARPALVAVSAPAGLSLASLQNLTDTLRGAMGPDGKLAVGGSLVTAPGMTEDELDRIVRAAGADHVGDDILDVAARCGLTGPGRRGPTPPRDRRP